jgi:energy-coupling factor transporter ATP-binding protein EcfA2
MTASRIHRLTLTHFRNYRAASLQTRGDVVVLVGPNGAGKTNCIEAISFLTPGRGLRRATLDDVADIQGDGSWAVSAEVEGAEGLATLGTGIDPPRMDTNTARRCRIDREPVSSATAFGDHLRIVWLTPAMDQLFMGAASERRRFFDRLVLAIDSQHSSRVSALDRALRSQGVVSLDSICHLDAPRKPAIRQMIEARVRRQELVAVEVDGAGKSQHWMRPEAIETTRIEPELTHILSPFDPLVIQRKRLELLFGYEHRFEAYVPKEKRVLGYFALPVLVGNEIVAAVDVKADRENKKLLMQKWTWIGKGTKTHKRAIEEELHRFGKFQFGE